MKVYPESEDLAASIKTISSSGEVKVEFNQEILIPPNITLINNEVLTLKVIPGEYSLVENLSFKWKIISLNEYFMKLQLYFDNPKYISSEDVNFLINYLV